MNDVEKSGRPFERLAAAVQKKLGPNAEVHSPLALTGRSGARISLDAAVRAVVGSAKMLVAIEAKDYSKSVGVEKVRAFTEVIEDVNAHKGIMVARSGYTRDALLTAAHRNIDTCVLRPLTDADWEGHIQHFSVNIQLMAHAFLDASIVLEGGREIPVPRHGRVALIVDPDEIVTFEGVVNGGLGLGEENNGRDAFLRPRDALWYPTGPRREDRARVTELRCRREVVEAMRSNLLVSSPHDYVFVKVTPEGESDESHFLEFRDLERIAEEFRRAPST